MYMQARNFGGLGDTTTGIDWGSILNTAVQGYVAVQGVKTQADLLKSQQQLQQQQVQNQLALQYAQNPQYSPQYGVPAPAQLNLMPLLLIGGGILAVVMLMK